MSTDPRLVAIGDALEHAITTELNAPAALASGSGLAAALHRARRWRPRRRATVLALAVAIALPCAALAATQLVWTDSQVAASLPQGTRALAGTEPTCTIVIANVEYHCTLAKTPSSMSGAPTGTTTPGKWVRVTFLELTRTLRNHHALALLRAHVIRFALVSKDGRRALVVSGRAIPQLTIPLLYLTSRPSSTTTTDWLGADEATVDGSKHVNGGCRALNATGTSWDCYIGEAAVSQNIVSQGFLGQYAPTPGLG